MAKPETRGKNRVRMPVQEARANLKDLLNRVAFRGERIIVTRYDEDSAALVSMADLAKIEAA
jgi:prevent-host-death family protein